MPERLMREPTRHSVPGHALRAALPSLGICLNRPAPDRRPIRLEQLPRGHEPELVEAAERGQVRGRESRWSTSRSFEMVSVKNFHPPGDLDPYPDTDALNRPHPRSRRADKLRLDTKIKRLAETNA
jgi:hypothetical protein